jgi:hypothetical protein
MKTPRYAEMVIDYRKIYEPVIDLAPAKGVDAKAAINSFGNFLKKAEKELEGLREQMESIVEARSGFTQHLSTSSTIQITAILTCCHNTKKMSTCSTFQNRKRKSPICSSTTTTQSKAPSQH